MVVQGKGGEEEVTTNGHRFHFLGDENVLNLDCADELQNSVNLKTIEFCEPKDH